MKTVAIIVISLLVACSQQQDKHYYHNESLQQAKGLVRKMTLDEKVNMLRYDSPGVQRLGIPRHNFWNECLHGVGRSGLATVFPQAIGMAAMWDANQMAAIADAISDEARAKHLHYTQNGKRNIYQGLTFWTPNINIFRDPRWGRGMETYGEDPFLTGNLAVPFIKGLQGSHPKYLKLVATAKHFAVHSGPESTRHSANVTPNQYDLEETYLPHFKQAVQQANVQSVMCAYQRIDDVPCCGNKTLIDKLRTDWGFKGYVVSDCWAIADFFNETAHHIVDSPEEAAVMGIQAGTDLNCGTTYLQLKQAVEQNLIQENDLDIHVERILTAMIKLGLVNNTKDNPYNDIPLSVVDSKKHQQLALEAARKSIVLLKNDNLLLPFSKNVKRVAVIGPNANDVDVLLGNYNGFSAHPKTPLAGIKDKLPNADVQFAQGCNLAENLPFLTPVPNDVLFTDAAATQHGLTAEYFGNKDWSGAPTHTRIDSTVNFIWWTTPPFEDLPYDAFSVRWTGVIKPPVSGDYTIGGEGFAGFKLFVNDSLFAQGKVNEHHPNKAYQTIRLEKNKTYNIKIEYVQDNTEYATMKLFWEPPKNNLLQEAVTLAQNSDLVILCLGLSPQLEGEDMTVKAKGFQGGDRLDIQLPETQTALIKKIYATGKPIVLVLLNGSALAINQENEHIPAIIEAWYPGQAGGTAIADVIFGDYNPAGRLPVTFYQSIEQLPPFDDYNMQGKTYRYFSKQPLYEFGYGLSYSTFAYNITTAPQQINAGDSIHVAADVTNTGQYDGDEVVQLYVEFPDSQLKTPLRSLQGFQRIHLKVGETKKVTFALAPQQFAGRDENNQAMVVTGDVRISVGGKQPDPVAINNKTVDQTTLHINGNYLIPE